MTSWEAVCLAGGRSAGRAPTRRCPRCSGRLDCRYAGPAFAALRDRPVRDGLSAYRDLLPLASALPSLGEGGTPLASGLRTTFSGRHALEAVRASGGTAAGVSDADMLAAQRALAGPPEDLLDRRPAPMEWSVSEVLGHLWDSEIAYSFRARVLLAQDAPRLFGYDQDAWATLARPGFAELLDAFEALRTANLALVRHTPEARWARVGLHAERGPISFRLLTETMAGHDRAHLQHSTQTIAAIRR